MSSALDKWILPPWQCTPFRWHRQLVDGLDQRRLRHIGVVLRHAIRRMAKDLIFDVRMYTGNNQFRRA